MTFPVVDAAGFGTSKEEAIPSIGVGSVLMSYCQYFNLSVLQSDL